MKRRRGTTGYAGGEGVRTGEIGRDISDPITYGAIDRTSRQRGACAVAWPAPPPRPV